MQWANLAHRLRFSNLCSSHYCRMVLDVHSVRWEKRQSQLLVLLINCLFWVQLDFKILYSLGRRRTTTLRAWGWRRGKGGGPHLGEVPGCPGSSSGFGWGRRAEVRLGCYCASTITVKGRNCRWLWLEPWPSFPLCASRIPRNAYHEGPLNLLVYQAPSIEGIVSLAHTQKPSSAVLCMFPCDYSDRESRWEAFRHSW